MTKKDYIAIADAIKQSIIETEFIANGEEYIDPNILIENITQAMEKNNPRFDRERFINYINK